MSVGLLAGLVLCACGQVTEGMEVSPVASEPITAIAEDSSETTQQPQGRSAGTIGEEAPLDETQLVQEAIHDLSRRLLVPVEGVQVVVDAEVELSEAATQCPGDTQILLSSDGRVYEYRVGENGKPTMCASGDKDGGYEFVPKPGIDE